MEMPTPVETAEQLFQRARQGDLEAASELVRMTYQRIYAWLFRLTGHADDAADLTQKCYARAWTSIGTFQGKSNATTWLHGIAYHVYVDWRRQNKVASERNEGWWENLPSNSPTPFQSAADRETAHLLYQWVEELPEEQRVVIQLRYYQELSLQEISETLGIAVSTVKYRVREALHRLQNRMRSISK